MNDQTQLRIGVYFLILVACTEGTALATGIIDVGSRKQLFVDDKLIARSQGITFTMNTPLKMNQPVLANDIPWEGEAGASIAAYSSVIKDGDKVRIWGSGKVMLPVQLAPGGLDVGGCLSAHPRWGRCG